MAAEAPPPLQQQNPSSDCEQALLCSFRALLRADPAFHDQGLDDATLRRFLRARSMNADKAHRFLLRHVQWRAEFVPKGSIPASEVQAELHKGKVYLQGADKAGHPIVVLMARRHYASDRDLQEFKKFIVYTVDKAVSSMPEGVERIVLIINLDGWTIRNADLKGYLALLEIVQDHYPERLHRVFLIHVPYLFWGVYKVLYPFIDPIVREKIVFVEDKHLESTLRKDIDKSQLPDLFGGELALKPLS